MMVGRWLKVDGWSVLYDCLKSEGLHFVRGNATMRIGRDTTLSKASRKVSLLGMRP